MDNSGVVTLDNYRRSKTQQSVPTAIDESLAQDQIDDIEGEHKYYLRKLYNALYIQMEACCTVITLLSVDNYRALPLQG